MTILLLLYPDGLVRDRWLTMRACRSVNNGERWNQLLKTYELVGVIIEKSSLRLGGDMLVKDIP